MALSFSGGTDRIIYNDASFLVGLSAFTVSCWVKCNATLPYDIGFFTTNNDWNGDNGICLRYDAVGINGGAASCIKCGITVGGVEHTYESQANTQTNDWQFIVWQWQSGSQQRLYVDGIYNAPSGTSGSTTPTGTTGPNNIDEVYFGAGTKGSSTTGWNGLMEDIRFYDRRISAAEIQTMFFTRGNDNIMENLLFRVLFNELPIGQTASTASIVDLTKKLGNADSVLGSPTYTESPGFASRRKTRN